MPSSIIDLSSNTEINMPAAVRHDEIPNNLDLWRQLVQQQSQLIEYQRAQMHHQQQVSKELENIKDILSQAKGGWRMFIGVGSAMTAIIAAGAWLWVNVLHVPK